MSELSALAAALDGQYDIEREIGRGGMGSSISPGT
jgi:hypothetical protein